MALRVLWLVAAAISVLGLAGCSSQDHGPPAGDPHGFELEVLGLAQGASLEDVEASLGDPVSEVTDGGESILNYRGWRLRFQRGALYQRVHETRGESTSLSRRILDHKVLRRLAPGMTVREARRILGPPEVYERIYESAQKPHIVLRYAYWELYFRGERLVRRTQN